jgi:hypothetical protein
LQGETKISCQKDYDYNIFAVTKLIVLKALPKGQTFHQGYFIFEIMSGVNRKNMQFA